MLGFKIIFALSSLVYLGTGAPASNSSEGILKQGCTCGQRGGNRIIGGEEADVGEFPWRVYLWPVGCGASIISESWVMTAAHCIDPEKDTYWVHVGDHDKRTSDEAQSEWVHVAQIIVHEGYNQQRGMANDIALLQLSNPLQFRHNVGQVCMPVREGRSRNTFENQPVTASGWGRTRTNSNQGSAVLMKADLSVLSNSRCRQSSQFQILESSICTYNRGKQPCNGDSGSSIDWQDSNGNYKAVGIVSHGEKDCHSTEPTVYARVTAYMDWIRQKTGETFCEV